MRPAFFVYPPFVKKFYFAVDTRRSRKWTRVVLCTMSDYLPKCNEVDAVKLDFFNLEEVELDRRLPTKHRHQYLDLTTLLINLPDLTFEVFKWTIIDDN